MPELPEVETVKRGLKDLIIGKQIKSVDFDWPKSFPNASSDVRQFLIGSKIIDVRRRAKVLMIDLDSNYSLVIHLKMTGQLVYRSDDRKIQYGAGHPNKSLIGVLPDKSTRVVISFNKSRLFFNDQRKFGWMKLIPTIEIGNIDFFKTVGPEPLSKDFTFNIFKKQLLTRKSSGIKAVLLDQKVIAGIGNIYADESLFASGIHPLSKVFELNDKQLCSLYNNIRSILKLSIKLGGSSDRNYIDAEGKKGSYLKFAKIFRLEGEPCPNCGTIIDKIKVAGRGTHICPSCQKYREKK